MQCHYCETEIESEEKAIRLGESDLFFCLSCNEKYNKPTMKKRIKDLRVRIDGLAQLTKSLKPLYVYGVGEVPSTARFSHSATEVGFTKPIGDSKEISGAIDGLYLAKAWLGKMLGELGTESPYPKDGTRKTIEDIEPTADTAKTEVDTPKGKMWYNHSDLVLQDWFDQGKSHIEKVDYLRQEIKSIIEGTEDFSDEEPHIEIEQGFVYKYLCEARFWLGFELQRIKENKNQ